MGARLQDIWMLLAWISMKYCSALQRDLAWDKCDKEAALALSGGRFVLCDEGQEEWKVIATSSPSLSLGHPHLYVFICILLIPHLFVSALIWLNTAPFNRAPSWSHKWGCANECQIILTFPPRRKWAGYRPELIVIFLFFKSCFEQEALLQRSIQKKGKERATEAPTKWQLIV